MIKVNGVSASKDLEIKELLALDENGRKGVRVHGMIYNIRDMGDFAFVILRKRGGLVQCVYNKNGGEDEKELLKEENSVVVTGDVGDEPRAVNGIEIRVSEMRLLSSPAEELPFAINKRNLNISIENELPIRPITLRNERRRTIFKLQAGLVEAF